MGLLVTCNLDRRVKCCFISVARMSSIMAARIVWLKSASSCKQSKHPLNCMRCLMGCTMKASVSCQQSALRDVEKTQTGSPSYSHHICAAQGRAHAKTRRVDLLGCRSGCHGTPRMANTVQSVPFLQGINAQIQIHRLWI